jgi:hypothetical protein
VNVNKNENDLTRKTSQQCKGRWSSMRRKYLGERACEGETRGTNFQWPLFNKINDFIGSSPKVTGLSNAIDSGGKKKKKVHKKRRTV